MRKATWFKPEDKLDIRRRQRSTEDGEAFQHHIARFGLEYRFNILNNLSLEDAMRLFELEKQNALYSMESELTKWIIEQFCEHPTEQVHGFYMVDSPRIPKGKPVLLVHPADRTHIIQRVDVFSMRFDFPKPLREVLKDG